MALAKLAIIPPSGAPPTATCRHHTSGCGLVCPRCIHDVIVMFELALDDSVAHRKPLHMTQWCIEALYCEYRRAVPPCPVGS
jgi:hypothetical protein